MSLGKKKILSQGAAGGIVGTDNFNTVIWTNGVNQHQSPITGVGFQPDLVWIKMRTAGQNHVLTDSVRGVTKTLFSNTSDDEETVAQGLTAFNADGFNLGNDDRFNHDQRDAVAWCWSAPTSESISASGSLLASTIKKNVAAGFSIVSYTGGGGVKTVSHGLSAAPELMIIKNRSRAIDGGVYTTAINSPNGSTGHLFSSSGSERFLASRNDHMNNNTPPTSSVFTVRSYDGSGNDPQNYIGNFTGDTYIAYLFHSVAGYQKVGTYTGTGVANNITETLGFSPRILMVKRTDSGSAWLMMDAVRNPSSPFNTFLVAQANSAEFVASALAFSYDSTSFTVANTDGTFNVNGGTYIYLAIA